MGTNYTLPIDNFIIIIFIKTPRTSSFKNTLRNDIDIKHQSWCYGNTVDTSR